MEHHIVRGNPVQVNWTFNSIAGGEFSLSGYYYRLYYSQGSQSVLATGVTHSGNTLTWSFTPDEQWKNGYYDILLEIYSSTTKILTITYPEVFCIVPADTTSETSTAVQNDVSTIDIESSCDFNRFTPVIPSVGQDGYWYVNGTKVIDAGGNYVRARGIDGTNGTDGTDGQDGQDGVDGRGISGISKTSSSGNVDTYTITFTSGSPSTFTVTNGTNGIDGIDGNNGKSIEYIWNGTQLGIRQEGASSYTYANLKGDTGATPNISVKSVTTGAAGTDASVTLDPSSTAAAPKFNFTIPRGNTGETGAGLIIKDSVATTSQLPSSGQQLGDAYLCEADNKIYIYRGGSGNPWFSMESTGYQLPSTGIPDTDLSSDVRASLAKADSALQSHQDITGKADKATTLAGYGITDAKIANGKITLGSNEITPLTSHQDITGKADKATTLAGYGITDAKINNGVITLGSNSITPLTSHQDISGKADKATTLAGYGITDAKIASGKITLGSNEITPLTAHQSIKTINGNTITGSTQNLNVGNIRCEDSAITSIVVLSESAYASLSTKVATTLYILTPNNA